MILRQDLINSKKNQSAIGTIKNRRTKQKYRWYFSWFLLVILILASSLILVYQTGFRQLKVKKGDIVTEIIKAPKTVTFKSISKTEELKNKAASEVPKIYRLDSKAVNEQENKTNSIFEKIDKIRAEDTSQEKKITDLKNMKELKLSDDNSKIILGLNPDDWNRIKENTKNILLELQKKEQIKYEELNNYKNQLPLKVNQSLSEGDKQSIIILSQGLLLPNTFLDEVETNKRINQAKDEVLPTYYTIEKDQIILKPGDRINDFDMEKLEVLGLTSSSFMNYKFLGILILVAILSILSFIFINYFVKAKIPSYKIFFIFTVFLLMVLIIARFALPLKPIIAYLFPLAAPVIILAILVDFRLGLFCSFIFAIFFGLVTGGSFELTVVQLLTILVSLLAVKNIKNFNVFLKLIVYITIVNFLVALSFNLLVGNYSLRTMLILITSGFLCGLINAIIVAGFMVFIGNLLGVTSFLQLSDLANPEQPLLKELSLNAPGTYHHSILVSNLAEQGAKAIGADPLLARVGAYYHDIGKIERPLFFVENQEGNLNIHEKMDPVKSVSYIINHVKDGIKIAGAYRLPSEIKNIIAEHHGTTHVQFFYELAKKKGLKIKDLDFRYSGPKPSTKESAIIMLADSVEASTRSLNKFTPQSVKKKIEEITKVRFEEGELDQSPLTARDLYLLKKSFIETASAVFHQRINYPQSPSSFKKIAKIDWFNLKK